MSIRLPKKNKVKMLYALRIEDVPVYETDSDGNIRYLTYGASEALYPSDELYPGEDLYPSEEEEVKIPVETGETRTGYDEPTEMKSSISYGNNTQAEMAEFGFDTTDYNATLICVKGEYPLVIGSLIWTDNEVIYRNDGMPEESSANFRVLAKKTSLSYDKYLLKAVQNG